MTWDIKKIHLIPPAVVDRVNNLLSNVSLETREIYAQQIEALRDYSQWALDSFEKQKKELAHKKKPKAHV